MAAALRCDHCGIAEVHQLSDRNGTPWPWYGVTARERAEEVRYDFCTAACLHAWAGARVQPTTKVRVEP